MMSQGMKHYLILGHDNIMLLYLSLIDLSSPLIYTIKNELLKKYLSELSP